MLNYLTTHRNNLKTKADKYSCISIISLKYDANHFTKFCLTSTLLLLRLKKRFKAIEEGIKEVRKEGNARTKIFLMSDVVLE